LKPVKGAVEVRIKDGDKIAYINKGQTSYSHIAAELGMEDVNSLAEVVTRAVEKHSELSNKSITQ